MSVTQPMAGWLMCPEIVIETLVTMAGKLASPKHLCPHHPSLHRRSLVEEEITQSRTILNNSSNFRHLTTGTRRGSVPTQALTRLHGVTQNPNNFKTPGPPRMDGQKTMGGMIRATRQMRTTNGRQMMGGMILIAVGTNNLILRHGTTPYLRMALIPRQHRMHRPVDGKAGARRRGDYPR